MGQNPHDVMENMATSFTGVENHHFFQLWIGQLPSKFDIVIPRTPVHKGMVVWILK